MTSGLSALMPRWMLAGVAAITGLRLVWLALQPADLFPDEAQYWVWSQQLALGYYSKPPLVAWLIALTTGLFGDSEFAVRLSAPLLHAGAAVFVYGIGARLYDRRVGFWSALAYASLPGVSVSAFIISTDAALLLFWAAALYAFVRAREEGGWGWWIAVGSGGRAGAAREIRDGVLDAVGARLCPAVSRRAPPFAPVAGRDGLALADLFAEFLVELEQRLCQLSPHQRQCRARAGRCSTRTRFIEFFGSQFGVFGPLLFAGLILLIATRRGLAEPRARLLAAFALPTLAMMLAVSLLSRAHANWAAPTYVSATVLVVAWALQRGWRGLVRLSIALHLAAVGLLFTGREALAAFGVRAAGPIRSAAPGARLARARRRGRRGTCRASRTDPVRR